MFSQFCRDSEGKFDYREWHAICIGAFLPYWMWPLVFHYDIEVVMELFEEEPWYVALGMTLRLLPILAFLVGKGIV